MSAIEPIRYFERPDCPGRFFACEKLSATLTTASCEKRWRAANDKHRKYDPCDPLQRCKGCALGATHAGDGDTVSGPFYGAQICSRCHRPSPRLIHRRLCPSCINREYELIKGRNGKGSRPIKAAALQRLGVTYSERNKVRTYSQPYALDMVELMVSVMKSNPSPVFCFSSHPVNAPFQLSLF